MLSSFLNAMIKQKLSRCSNKIKMLVSANIKFVCIYRSIFHGNVQVCCVVCLALRDAGATRAVREESQKVHGRRRLRQVRQAQVPQERRGEVFQEPATLISKY